MASVNKAIIVGNLGKDVDLRYMPNGDAVANITVATTETWKDKDGNKQEATEWHRITFFRGLAEIVGKYLKKGSQVYIEGKIKTRKYTDKEGVERYVTEIIGDDMKMLGSRDSGGNNQSNGNQSNGNQRPAQGNGNGNSNGNNRSSNQQPPRSAQGAMPESYEDDIPFTPIPKKMLFMV